MADQTGGGRPGPVRAARDSRPRWGAGPVEAPDKLLGHARKQALGVSARQPGRDGADLAAEAGASGVAGSSLTAALDLDGAALDQPAQGVAAQPAAADPAVAARLAAARPVQAQDPTTTTDGAPMPRQGGPPTDGSVARLSSGATAARAAAS